MTDQELNEKLARAMGWDFIQKRLLVLPGARFGIGFDRKRVCAPYPTGWREAYDAPRLSITSGLPASPENHN